MNTSRCVGLALVLASALGCGLDSAPPPPPAESDDLGRASGVASPPLRVGAVFPPLRAEGWLNGTPPAPGAPGVRLMVVDVWALWCPYCAMSAPGLTRAYEKYSPQGVAFVGITNTNKKIVENFVKTHALPWPNGYGATEQMIAALGAGSGMSGPSPYEVAPTLYLVGPDGRVRWTDSRGRDRHQDPKDWERILDDAIADALRE